jgi:hypothetical protein
LPDLDNVGGQITGRLGECSEAVGCSQQESRHTSGEAAGQPEDTPASAHPGERSLSRDCGR